MTSLRYHSSYPSRSFVPPTPGRSAVISLLSDWRQRVRLSRTPTSPQILHTSRVVIPRRSVHHIPNPTYKHYKWPSTPWTNWARQPHKSTLHHIYECHLPSRPWYARTKNSGSHPMRGTPRCRKPRGLRSEGIIRREEASTPRPSWSSMSSDMSPSSWT